MNAVAKVKFTTYETSIAGALDCIGAGSRLPRDGLIIIKPNLTKSSLPPVTTPVGVVEVVFQYCKARSNARIAIGEGAGQGRTGDVFLALGYTDLAKKHGIELNDFNEAESTKSMKQKNDHKDQSPHYHRNDFHYVSRRRYASGGCSSHDNSASRRQHSGGVPGRAMTVSI